MTLRTPLASGVELDRFQLINKLAIGGMAEIWLARDVDSDQPVVIKAVLAHLSEDPLFLNLFHAEAAIARQLDHPNIIRFITQGERRGIHYLALEYISGPTLRAVHDALTARRKAVPPWFVLHVVAEVCRGLDYAHQRRDDGGQWLEIVHRDITPDNVMITTSGVAKIVDFGVAKSSSAGAPDTSGQLTGKLAYLAPEQILDPCEVTVDRRTDVYALGVLLYEMLTGIQPFRASNDMALLFKIPREVPTPPSTIARWIPSRLSATIMRAMAKSPEQRFQTTAKLADELGEGLSFLGEQVDAVRVAELIGQLIEESPPPGAETDSSSAPVQRSSPPIPLRVELRRGSYPAPLQQEEESADDSEPPAL